MSLFPAYAGQSQDTPAEKPEQDNWLENSSFQVDVSVLNPSPNVTEQGNDTPSPEPPSKKLKKSKPSKVAEDDADYIIDLHRTKEFLNMKSIPRPPKYHIAHYHTANIRKNKRKKFKRYYQCILKGEDDKSADEEEPKITKNTIGQLQKHQNENFTGFQQEGHLSETTAFYNKKLAINPKDIKLWLEYVRFQDTVYQFEKTYRKGSIAKGLRVMAERKLSILDKALACNNDCEELLRERLNVAVSVYPADELQVQLRNLVEKDQGNIILWQGYIEATQCSMSHCNTPNVLKLYIKCLSVLHKIRRNVTIEKRILEESILKMLYQCGLFLKQAGLFEQLWTLLRLYLELNLASNDKTKFNITSGFDDKQLVELEEIIFKSQLPLHELWLRTEKLRESCHWLPYTEDENCEDPQRIVLTEDVAELIHPITMPENMFKLIGIILTLLKIPLLPCRHTTMQILGLDHVPWALDSIESLLPTFFPIYQICLNNKNFLVDQRMAVGPQYLKVLPGQEEYLNFVVTIMKNCIDCLNSDDKIAMTVWWLRFQRLLVILDKDERLKLPGNTKKKIRSNIKNLLKLEENRNNILYYCEYALFEKDSGNIDTCLNILKTSLNFKTSKIIYALSKSIEQASFCYLYRILIENTESKEQALKYLITYVLEKNQVIDTVTEELLHETSLKFKHITLQILQNDLPNLAIAEQFLPHFPTDWIICNGWFLYFTKGPLTCGSFIEETLSELDEKSPEITWQKEILFEFYVAVLFKHCIENPGFGIFKILDDVLFRAIEYYPNNFFFLSILSKEQSLMKSSGQWWKIKNLLIKTGRAIPSLFLVLIANQQVLDLQESVIDTLTGDHYAITNSFKYRLLSLFKHLTRSDMCTRRCGLIWRLYLQFVHTHFDASVCRNVYYIAVEECPWLKALYIDAAIYIPAELAQIQDLIIEKQLRLHVTPEELDILRS